VAAVATRDSNSESRTCIGGRLDIWVGWSRELRGLRGDGESLPWMEGSLVCGGEDCALAGAAAGAAISSALAWWDSNPRPMGGRQGVTHDRV
jgi:hypothetical protein